MGRDGLSLFAAIERRQSISWRAPFESYSRRHIHRSLEALWSVFFLTSPCMRFCVHFLHASCRCSVLSFSIGLFGFLRACSYLHGRFECWYVAIWRHVSRYVAFRSGFHVMIIHQFIHPFLHLISFHGQFGQHFIQRTKCGMWCHREKGWRCCEAPRYVDCWGFLLVFMHCSHLNWCNLSADGAHCFPVALLYWAQQSSWHSGRNSGWTSVPRHCFYGFSVASK